MYKLVVLFSVVCLAAAKPGAVVPLAYSSVVPAVSSLSQYSSSVVHGTPYASVYSAPFYAPYSALAQPPHAPAVFLDAVNGVPLDTPEVVAARAAHFQAKALSGLHHLKKRSVVAPVAYSSVVSPLVSSYSAAPVVSAYSSSLVSPYAAAYSPVVSAYSAPGVLASPLAYSGVVPKAYSVHPW